MGDQPKVTLKDRFYPARAAQPSCIQLPAAQGNNYELKSQFITMLPHFHGLPSEDAYLFLREFEEVCVLIKIQQLTDDAVKLRCITFSLKDGAKRWLYQLPTNSITTWEQFTVAFLKKFFPLHKTNKLRSDIMQFKQKPGESFSKLMERFQGLLQECPHHGVEKWHLCQIIYEGIDYHTKQMLESMCSLDSFTAYEDENDAWDFLVDLAEKTREWESTQENDRSQLGKGFHVEGVVAKEAHLDSLIKRLETIVFKEPNPINQVSQVPMCSWCQSPGHVMEECPNTSVGNVQENVSALSLNNPYSSTYNPGWRNHPNFSWNQGNRVGPSNFQSQGPPAPQRPNFAPRPNLVTQANFGPQGPQVPTYAPQPNYARPPLQAPYPQPPGFINTGEAARISELEKNMALLMTSHNTVERQLSQLVTLLHEKEKGTLPSQPEPNPRHQVSIQQDPPPLLNQIPNHPRPGPSGDCNMIYALQSGQEYQQESVPQSSPLVTPVATPPVEASSEPPPSGLSDKLEEIREESPDRVYVPKVPYPSRLASNKKATNVEKVLEVLKQVRVNIPLLDAITQVPAYAKVLKDLCTQKRRTNVPKKAFLAANISSLINQPVATKYKDPGSPTISCIIGNTKIDHALLNLGASVNLLPYHVYQQLGLGELKPTTISLQLADRSVKTPKGMVEDVLIKVGEFVFPVDFVVLDTQLVPSSKDQIPIILGRPFLATSNALINCRNGLMKLSFGNMSMDFNIFRLGKQPNLHEEEVHMLQEIPDSIATYFDMDFESGFQECMEEVGGMDERIMSKVWNLQPRVEPPELELKKLPFNLSNAFLSKDQTLPVIITSDLTLSQEEELIKFLQENKEAIGRTIHIVPNANNELIPIRVQTGWQLCMDYRKLNAATWTDHLPLPFIDQDARCRKIEELMVLHELVYPDA